MQMLFLFFLSLIDVSMWTHRIPSRPPIYPTPRNAPIIDAILLAPPQPRLIDLLRPLASCSSLLV